MSHFTYIDGTNLLLECAKEVGIRARADKPTHAHLMFACALAKTANPYMNEPKRKYWFASYQGNDEDRSRIRGILRGQGFEAVLFKKNEGREKGVDISLTKEMLVHAFHRNSLESILVAGDEDYVPLVNEVKRYGQRVLGYFFKRATSDELQLSLDIYWDLSTNLTSPDASKWLREWKNENQGA